MRLSRTTVSDRPPGRQGSRYGLSALRPVCVVRNLEKNISNYMIAMKEDAQQLNLQQFCISVMFNSQMNLEILA